MKKQAGARVGYTVVLETPSPPNFLFVDGLVVEGTAAKVSIADVPDAELKKLGKRWTDNLLERAAELRKNRSAKPGRPA